MSSSKVSESCLDAIDDVNITLLTLRKPTDLGKVIDSVPKPIRSVPKNGLPLWYKLGLERKLPVPKMPKGKILFSRGRIGEDVRRMGLGDTGPRPTFDLTDPYCNNISYDYVPCHDPHLQPFFAQKPARNRMKTLGFCTQDNRAVCSLKEFNQYRKYLYNQFMDRIHMEMKKMDERARDDLTLKRVEVDVARRKLLFIKQERAREHMDRVAKENAAEWAEKKRLAKEQERKIKARMTYLAEFNEKLRKERAEKAHEKENRCKQRVQAAAEIELRRKITMVRQWRMNEKKRQARLKLERETKQKMLEDEAERKWVERIESQNQKIRDEECLLRVYTEDMNAAAQRRARKAEVYAYNTDLELQRIRLANWKLMHGGTAKAVKLVRKMGVEFEKSKRGTKGMSLEVAHEMAEEAMQRALATRGDALMILGQARAQMDVLTVYPQAPVRIMDELMDGAILEFARRRVNFLLHDVEREVHGMASIVFFQNFRTSAMKKSSKPPRWSAQVAAEIERANLSMRAGGGALLFGEVEDIPPEDTHDHDMKSVRDRPPTPVPSKTKLAEVTFADRIEDLPDPVALSTDMPERAKLLENVSTAGKLLSRAVSRHVEKGMDPITGNVTLPHMKIPMEWGEAVEGLAQAVLDNRVHADSSDVRRVAEFLTRRLLSALNSEMKSEKAKRRKTSIVSDESETAKDFYDPSNVKEAEGPGGTQAVEEAPPTVTILPPTEESQKLRKKK